MCDLIGVNLGHLADSIGKDVDRRSNKNKRGSGLDDTLVVELLKRNLQKRKCAYKLAHHDADLHKRVVNLVSRDLAKLCKGQSQDTDRSGNCEKRSGLDSRGECLNRLANSVKKIRNLLLDSRTIVVTATTCELLNSLTDCVEYASDLLSDEEDTTASSSTENITEVEILANPIDCVCKTSTDSAHDIADNINDTVKHVSEGLYTACSLFKEARDSTKRSIQTVCELVKTRPALHRLVNINEELSHIRKSIEKRLCDATYALGSQEVKYGSCDGADNLSDDAKDATYALCDLANINKHLRRRSQCLH